MTLSPPTPELPVPDVEAAQAYYRDHLGFEVAWHNPKGRIGAVNLGDIAIFFRETEGPIYPATFWIYAAEIDVAYATMQANGADIIAPLADQPWGLRQFTLRDHVGNIFHIHHDT